jgi:hydroxymethylbilane synthase
MKPPILRIASRGSPLALVQARLARDALALAHGWDAAALDELCPILTFRTTGDRIQDRPLAESGGKGLFVKEIEDALLQDEADVAVHSMKDMPGVHPAGLTIAAVLEREDPRDVFIGREADKFASLKPGARLGTSSVRRQAQARRLRPDLVIVPLRGNVETRLAKLGRGEADATLLARAGLERLGVAPHSVEILDTEHWLPALCQGAIGLEIRGDDTRMRDLLAPLDHEPSHLAIACERGFLRALDGSCRTPIAGLALVDGGTLQFTGEVLTPDGRDSWAASRKMDFHGSIDETALKNADSLGQKAAHDIRLQAEDLLPRF